MTKSRGASIRGQSRGRVTIEATFAGGDVDLGRILAEIGEFRRGSQGRADIVKFFSNRLGGLLTEVSARV
jgi:hypothetical protein